MRASAILNNKPNVVPVILAAKAYSASLLLLVSSEDQVCRNLLTLTLSKLLKLKLIINLRCPLPLFPAGVGQNPGLVMINFVNGKLYNRSILNSYSIRVYTAVIFI